MRITTHVEELRLKVRSDRKPSENAIYLNSTAGLSLQSVYFLLTANVASVQTLAVA